jgi:hypothetical protein
MPPDRPRFHLITPEELDAFPDPTYLIDGILPDNSFCMLYGESGCGKSFIALSMGLHVAAGHPWFGRTVRKGTVLYFAMEGLRGRFNGRVRAHQIKHNFRAADIRYSDDDFNLLDQTDMLELGPVISKFKPRLIILDTLARLTPGADENSAGQMGLAVAAIKSIMVDTGASVIVVHHTRKSGNVERGSSALRAAVDVMIECSRTEEALLVKLVCTKMKDAEEFKPINLGLEKIILGPSSSSLAVGSWKEVMASVEKGSQSKGLGRPAKKALEILSSNFPEGARHSDWRDECGQLGMSEAAFARALRELKEHGAVRQDDLLYFANKPDGGVSVSDSANDTMTPRGGVVSPPSPRGVTLTPRRNIKTIRIYPLARKS